jgi:hypothetical protein
MSDLENKNKLGCFFWVLFVCILSGFLLPIIIVLEILGDVGLWLQILALVIIIYFIFILVKNVIYPFIFKRGKKEKPSQKGINKDIEKFEKRRGKKD